MLQALLWSVRVTTKEWLKDQQQQKGSARTRKEPSPAKHYPQDACSGESSEHYLPAQRSTRHPEKAQDRNGRERDINHSKTKGSSRFWRTVHAFILRPERVAMNANHSPGI